MKDWKSFWETTKQSPIEWNVLKIQQPNGIFVCVSVYVYEMGGTWSGEMEALSIVFEI